ncbi:M48 family metallopeptidase [Patescibacteria group bacterium]|nr:M48 family metallopeptidase [Patescibacteria group bacterium]
MQNVYEQVSANKTRSFFIVFLFIAFITLAVYLVSFSFDLGSQYIFYAFSFSTASAFVSYFSGDKIILALNQAKPVDRQEFFDFYTVTENLASTSQLPIPKIYVIDSASPNAFATGRDPKHASICATTGLLQKLNRSELEAVIAHELSHIKNYDTRLMMIVSLLIGTLSILTRNSFYGHSRKKSESSGILALVGLFFLIFSPLVAKLIQLAISRRREYLADALAVKTTRQPQALIDALQKISQDPNILESASPATASLYIENPFKNQKLSSLFSTHPPLEKRITTLKQML